MKAILKKLLHKKMLMGVDAIMAAAGWVDISTVTDRRIAFSETCPIRKTNGILCVGKREFRKWLKAHPEAAKEILRPPFECVQTRKIKLRWGLERTESRKIII